MKVFKKTVSGVNCTTDKKHPGSNYIELTSTVDDVGNNLNFTLSFHFHEPWGYNCYGVSYMWYIRFFDKNGNAIPNRDINITPTNINGYAARLFYYPLKTSAPAENVLDRYAVDDASDGHGGDDRKDVYGYLGLSYRQEAVKNATGTTSIEGGNTVLGTVWRRNLYTDSCVRGSISKASIPSNAVAYGNYIVFAQYKDHAGRIQDPTDGDNQFSSYVIPEGNVAINDDDTILDTSSKAYYKNGNWQNTARIYHKENGTWVKRYLYKKVNGTWKKV